MNWLFLIAGFIAGGLAGLVGGELMKHYKNRPSLSIAMGFLPIFVVVLLALVLGLMHII